MTVKAFDKLCNYYGISKVTYLASATFFTTGFIIECIMLYLVIIPYLSEQKFINTNCTYIDAADIMKMTLKRCENKCTKETSYFPCLYIKIMYTRINDDKLLTANLFDNFRTYNKQRIDKCSTMPCFALIDDNRRWVVAFNQSVFRKKKFSCFYSADEPNYVLLYKLQSQTVVLHCVFWPCGLLTLGLVSIFLTWYCAGCKIWSQDKTVIA